MVIRQVLINNKLYQIDVDPYLTFAGLKYAIKSLYHIPIEQQIIYVDDILMYDYQSIYRYRDAIINVKTRF